MTRARSVTVALFVAALSSCGSSGTHVRSPGTTAPTAPAPTTTVAVPTTVSTVTTLPATTTTAEPGGPYATFTTPDAADMALIDAWRRGDRGRASQVATPAAIRSLFAVPPPASSLDFRGCNAGLGGMASCFYRIGNNALSVQLRDVPPTHWQVVAASFVS